MSDHMITSPDGSRHEVGTPSGKLCQSCGIPLRHGEGVIFDPHRCYPQHFRMQQEILAALNEPREPMVVTDEILDLACRAYNDVAYGIREDNASRSAMLAALEAALGGGE